MRRARLAVLWIPTALALLVGVVFLSSYEPDLPFAELVAKYTNDESEFVDVAGMRVHYRDEGSGDVPLILLHGTGASLHTWDGWTPVLVHDFRIIRLDLPGFGLTGPAPDSDYTVQAYVEYLAAFADALGIERFHLAGNSLGGQIAWNFATRYPDRVMKLVLIDSAGYPKEAAPSASTVIRLAGMPVINELMVRPAMGMSRGSMISYSGWIKALRIR